MSLSSANKREYATALLIVIVGVFFFGASGKRGNAEPLSPAVVLPPNPYLAVNLSATAAYVFDVAGQHELFSKNGEAQLPLASLTKIMTAITALSFAPPGTTILIQPKYLAAEGDTGLQNGEVWQLRDLLDFTLVESSNDGAVAIADTVGRTLAGGGEEGETAFIRAMNVAAKKIGLTQTYFLNETGLDKTAGISGAYGSARDVAHLFAYAIEKYPDIFESTKYDTITVRSDRAAAHDAKNTNHEVDKIPGLLASKTGYTDLAGGNLVVAFDAGLKHPIVVAVLGGTYEGRFEDTIKLVYATLHFLSNRDL